MHHARPLLPLLLFLALNLVVASGAAQAPDPTQYPPPPWHLVDTWWDLGEAREFESLAVDVTISDDVSDNVNLYVAPIGLGHLDKTPFYGGVQTRADGNTRQDPKLRTIGRGFLFSMWGERSLDAIRPPDGGFLQSSGHEGDFVSVRRPFAWQKGKYTYRLTRMDREEVDGRPYTWVGAFVHAHERDEHLFVGALRFPGERLKLAGRVANFVEIYGRQRPVSWIPEVTVTFGAPRVNGRAVPNAKAEAIYPKGVPDYADVAAQDGSLVVTVGRRVENREQRRVSLIGGTP